MFKKVTYEDAVCNRIFNDNVSKRIEIIIPAHNEENSIGDTLDSLVKLEKPEGILVDVFIALDNCTDNTEEVVKEYSDKLNIYALETVNNKERKVGALNQVYRLFFGDMSEQNVDIEQPHLNTVDNVEAFLGIDADVYLDKKCLTTLYSELNQKYNVGGVSANYTCLYPESKRKILKNDPEAQDKISSGQYGGAIARFITAQSNKSFAQWTLNQKVNGYTAEILGGQCTLFKFDALKEVFDKYKLNGVYDNTTETEDLLLTQQLRELGWKCKISRNARCFVDSMNTMKAYVSQQTKWKVGKLDYTTKTGVSTSYARKNWVEEITLFMNLTIRTMLIVLVPSAMALNEFKFNWIWALPFIFSVILNTMVALKTPNKRFIDVLLSVTTISAEFSIWFDSYISIVSWRELSRAEKKDTWALQEAAENGTLKANNFGLYSIILVVALVVTGVYFNIINIDSALQTIKPYIASGFNLLTYLTMFTTILMLFKLAKIRGNFKA